MTVKIDKGHASGVLNLTPMIDIVFQLLLFYIVTSTFAVEAVERERQLDVVLPQASEAKPLIAKPRETVISIDRQGNLFLGARPVSLSALETELRQAAVNNPGKQTVIIRADRQGILEHAVDVMNACQKANITDYRLMTSGD